MNFQKLSTKINLEGFDCGVKELNDFLLKRAIQEAKQRLSLTMVAMDDQSKVIAYYSVSPSELQKDLIPKEGRGVPYPSVPAIRIGRLAVSLKLQGKGVGAMILQHALKKCLNLSNGMGGRVVVVDAKNEKAVSFYSRYGFKTLKERPMTMVIKVSTIEKSLK
ncbi:MAG: GNAT family N-acetyltransferase [Waddliaceae bacterium]|nr:GNAT family N-acetyltransferase [Waddliaceae bacterium]